MIKLLSAAAIIGSVLSGLAVWREIETARIVRSSRAIVAGELSYDAISTVRCLGPCPVTARIAMAAARNATAERRPDAGRRLVSQNERDLKPWLEGKGARADALAQIAQGRFILAGGVSPDVVQAFDASYRASAYSTAIAPWRVAAGASMWPNLSPDLRRKVLDEAIWARLVRPEEAELIDSSFQDPAAAAALSLRERRVRGDEMHGVVARRPLGH